MKGSTPRSTVSKKRATAIVDQTPSHRPAKKARGQSRKKKDDDSSDMDVSLEEIGYSYHFATDIFPLLKKFMDYSLVRYSYRGITIGAEDDVRRWLCKNGVPDHNNTLTKEEEETLTRWASLANVKFSDLKLVKLCSQENIIELLYKMGLQQQASDGSFQFATGRGPSFQSLEEIRDRLRTEGRTIFPRAAFVNKLSEQEQVQLRAWAASAVVATPNNDDVEMDDSPAPANVVSPEVSDFKVRSSNMERIRDFDEDTVNSITSIENETKDVSSQAELQTRNGSIDDEDTPLPTESAKNEFEEEIVENTGHSKFRESIHPLLMQFFGYSRNEYKYQGKVVGNDVDARIWICRHGVPPCDNLTAEDIRQLQVWASYALVKLGDLNHLVTEYSEKQIEEALRKLHVNREEDGTFSIRGENLGNLDDVARLLCTEGAQSIHRSAYTKLSEEEQANLRLWAARRNCRNFVAPAQDEVEDSSSVGHEGDDTMKDEKPSTVNRIINFITQLFVRK